MQIHQIKPCKQNFNGRLIAKTSDGDIVKVEASSIKKIVQEIDNKATVYYIENCKNKSFQVKYDTDFQTVLAAYTAAMQRPVGIEIDISKIL